METFGVRILSQDKDTEDYFGTLNSTHFPDAGSSAGEWRGFNDRMRSDQEIADALRGKGDNQNSDHSYRPIHLAVMEIVGQNKVALENQLKLRPHY